MRAAAGRPTGRPGRAFWRARGCNAGRRLPRQGASPGLWRSPQAVWRPRSFLPPQLARQAAPPFESSQPPAPARPHLNFRPAGCTRSTGLCASEGARAVGRHLRGGLLPALLQPPGAAGPGPPGARPPGAAARGTPGEHPRRPELPALEAAPGAARSPQQACVAMCRKGRRSLHMRGAAT